MFGSFPSWNDHLSISVLCETTFFKRPLKAVDTTSVWHCCFRYIRMSDGKKSTTSFSENLLMKSNILRNLDLTSVTTRSEYLKSKRSARLVNYRHCDEIMKATINSSLVKIELGVVDLDRVSLNNHEGC